MAVAGTASPPLPVALPVFFSSASSHQASPIAARHPRPLLQPISSRSPSPRRGWIREKRLNFFDLFHRSGGSNARSASGSPSPRRSVQLVDKDPERSGNPTRVSRRALYLLDQGWPVILREFGVDNRGGNVNDNRYYGCAAAVAADLNLDCALWTLQGSTTSGRACWTYAQQDGRLTLRDSPMLCLHAGVRFAGHVGRRARRHSGLPAWNRHALPGRRRRRPERGHQPVPVPQCGQQLRPGEPVVQAGDQQQERRCQGNAALAAAPQATELQASCRTTAAHRHRPPTKTSCASSYGRKFSPLISHARLI